MKLEISLVRTRVARRLLGLFLLCAVAPVLTFAALSYREVHDGVVDKAREQLRRESRMSVMVIIESLNATANRLKELTGGAAPAGADDALFDALVWEHANGTLEPLRGRLGMLPALDARQRDHLARGMPVLTVGTNNGDENLYFAFTQPSTSARLWAQVSLERFAAGIDVAAGEFVLCVVTMTGTSLVCPDEATARIAASLADQPTATRDWDLSGERLITAHANAFLIPSFAAMPWTVSLTMPFDAATEPLAPYRRTFVLGVLLAVILVFTVSHIEIRRHMAPLAVLTDGTQRLHTGDFSTRVVVESDDEFKALAGSFNEMAGELERQFATLAAFHAIDRAALEGRSALAMADAVLNRACTLLDADHVGLAVATFDADDRWVYHGASAEENGPRSELIDVSADDIASLSGRSPHLWITAGSPLPGYCGQLQVAGAELLVYPILRTGVPFGALIVARSAGDATPQGALELGRQLADQFALGLSNTYMLDELHALSVGSLTALARTIDAASPWTGGHSERVTQCAVEIGRRMGLDDGDLVRLRHGGLLHDIGKIGIPAAILDKTSRLTNEELAVMQSHPVLGASIVQSVRAFRDLVPLVMHHHELLDGSGYPHGLHGDQIPQLVRILTVADVYDALVSDRPYRAGLSPEAALETLFDGIGRKFEPLAVTALEQMIREQWRANDQPVAPGGDQQKAAPANLTWEETFV